MYSTHKTFNNTVMIVNIAAGHLFSSMAETPTSLFETDFMLKTGLFFQNFYHVIDHITAPLNVFYQAFLLGTSLYLFVLALFEYQFLFVSQLQL